MAHPPAPNARSIAPGDSGLIALKPQAPPNVEIATTSQHDDTTPWLAEEDGLQMSTWRLANIILAVAGVSFLSSFATGVLTIGLPQTAIDIKLSEDLIFWPSSVYSLASGSCLLLAGSVADVVGNRPVNLIGCFLVGCFILACGLARTGIELIMFRAMQGVAVSLCLPTSVAIVSNSVPNGRTRNIAFSCLGFVQPVGFSVGLVLGGLMLDTIGWRLGYYISGGLTFLLFMISVKALPAEKKTTGRDVLTKLRTDIDWIGGFVSCVSLCLFSYILAALTNDISNIKSPVNITLLIIAVALVPVFILWEQRQERRGQPALMPNSLWKNRIFTNICLMVMFAWGVCNVMELFCSLFFQKVQNLNAFEASIRILPSMIVGSICQLSTGLLIHRFSAFYLVVGSMILSGGGPLLMAVIDARWPYWYDAFFAQLLAPLSADILFTIGLLVVSDLFPTRTQALAGAVFNTVSQFGTSIGLTVMAVISSATTKHYSKSASNSSSPEALLVGYRAGFWAAFAWMMIAFLIGAFGLRNIGKVGLKRD